MSRKNLVLGGILVVLVALAYVYQGPLKEWKSSLGKPDNILSVIEPESVTGVEITRKGNTTVLIKEGDEWKIDGTKDFYLIESDTVNLESSIIDATKAEVEIVSTNPDKKSEFWTNEESGIRIKFKQGGADLIEFIVGKLSSDFTSTYISQFDSNETFAFNENIRSGFEKESWYDKTIMSTDKSNITKIRFQYPDREFTIEKQDDVWTGTLPYRFNVDKEKAKEILDIVSNLRAAQVPEQNFLGTGLEKHSIIVQITGEEIDNTLMVGDQNEEGLYYAKRSDKDNIYLITEEEKETLDTRIRLLR